MTTTEAGLYTMATFEQIAEGTPFGPDDLDATREMVLAIEAEAVNAALDKVAALVEAAKERDALIVRIEPVDYIAYEAAAERYRNALAAIEAARPKR